MITVKKIYKAIRDRLTEIDNNNVQIKDVKNISRPCWYIKYAGGQKHRQGNYETATADFEIYYFAQQNALIELLTAETTLQDLLQYPIPIDTKYIEVLDNYTIDIDEDEYITQADFSIEYEQIIDDDDDTTPLMQNIYES